MQHIPPFKIHCSAIHNIVGSTSVGLTAIQAAELHELQNKKKALTYNQELRLGDLIRKRDAKPVISAGAKTFCEQWLKSILYSETYEFTSKQTDKGNECEPSGIEMVAQRMGYGLISKNEETFEDEYMIGTPDLVLKDIIEEIKCPYTSKTFPLFDTEIPTAAYDWQQQGYMNLTGRKKAAVNYCLINAPGFIVELETAKKARSLGMIDIPMELYDEVEANMSYDNVPIELRHKRFEIARDEQKIETIKQSVIMCREYIETLLSSITASTHIALHDPAVNAIIHDKI